MRVSEFMIPAGKVVTATAEDSVLRVMDLMTTYRVGAVVIVKNRDDPSTEKAPVAVGIVTKTDILAAYKANVQHSVPCQKIMGKRRLVSCTPDDEREAVAKILEENKTHHVIVVDANQSHFVGLVSSWDVAAQCAKGGFSWFPQWKKDVPVYDPDNATSILNHPHEKREAATFMDDLDLEGFQ